MSIPVEELKDRLKKALSIRNMKPIELSEKTGIPKSAISQYMSGYTKPKQDRIYLISKALNISESWLLGYNVDFERSSDSTLTKHDERDIEKILNNTKELLLSQEGLMFDGQPASEESINSILQAMQIGIEMAKQKSKEKYTPKNIKRIDAYECS